MKRYLIERDISGVGNLSAEQLKGVAAKSNSVLAKLAPNIQWLNRMWPPTRRSASTLLKARHSSSSMPSWVDFP